MLTVGVIGAGFAGSAVALFLANAGHRVTLLEAVAAPGPVGAGIMLQPSGMLALARLGLLDSVLAHGEPVAQLRCARPSGREIFRLRYDAWAPGWCGLGLHRGVLFETLFRSACDHPAIAVKTGVECTHLEDEGQRIRDRDGGTHGPFDLVVVADGARSRIRRHLLPGAFDRPYPWGALWWMTPDPERRFRDELLQVVRDSRTMLGLLPTGRPPGGGAPMVSFFWSVRADAAARLAEEGLEAFRARVHAVHPPAVAVLEEAPSMDALLFAAYRDVRVRPPHLGRVLFVGDAAHATSPQLGQGSNLALLDAMTLADVLAEQPDPLAALPEYGRRRRHPLRFYQWLSRALTPFFQSDAFPLGHLRDLLFPIAARLPVVERQMVATMCGVKRGLLRRSLPLPGPPPLLGTGGSGS